MSSKSYPVRNKNVTGIVIACDSMSAVCPPQGTDGGKDIEHSIDILFEDVKKGK